MKQITAIKPARFPKFSFIRNIVGELRKVAWPSRQEASRLTLIVLIVTLIVAAILGLTDFAFSEFVDAVLLR